MKSIALLLLSLAFSGRAFAAAMGAAPTPAEIEFFEKKIRPVLADQCYQCHSEGAEKIRGGLLLDTREGIRRGGDSGPAVVPGKPAESLLVDAIRATNKDTAMPPQKAGGKLPDPVIADFVTWVKMGAPDPRDGAARVVRKHDDAEARSWWSFQPVQTPPVPQPADGAWARADVDRFIRAALEEKGLAPVADADRATLIRRVYFDLTGLPPALEEIDAFLVDESPDAFAKVVDRLLASPAFGERWGRHWLDVARYAESSGKDVNIAFPHAWRYRDYVIAAFNADKPYDQFIREQVAGDLMLAPEARDRADKLIATGFLAIGAKSLNERNPRQFAMDLADEQIDTVSQAVLGVTVACARCHDHKFDPISQREYYALAGIFLSTETRYGTLPAIQNANASTLLELPGNADLPVLQERQTPEERARLERQVAEARTKRTEMVEDGLRMRREQQRGEAERGNSALRFVQIQQAIGRAAYLEEQLRAFDEQGRARAFCMGVEDKPTRADSLREVGGLLRMARGGTQAIITERLQSGQPLRRPQGLATIGDSPLLARGDVDKPGERVPRGFPAALGPMETRAISASSSGRLELAEWLTSAKNPLTARVLVNRVWHWLFGRGIVESVDNFGTMGQRPVNQPLLDHLAARFVAGGWSTKKLIREIVLSRTYQLGSEHQEKAAAIDPENRLHWRMNPRRLDAECVRDAMLAIAGNLQREAPVGSLIARAGNGPIGGLTRFVGVREEDVIKATGNFRSVYLPIARDVIPEALAVFDFSEPSLVTGARETTNVPAQALFLLNGDFVAQQASLFAERIVAAYPVASGGGATARLDERLRYAWWLAFGRAPKPAECLAVRTFLGQAPTQASDGREAWTSLCRALFATAEFRYVN